MYSPLAWFKSNPSHQLPPVMMIIVLPLTLLRTGCALGAVSTPSTNRAACHHGFAPTLMFVDPTGSFDTDTECVNGIRGNAPRPSSGRCCAIHAPEFRGGRSSDQLGYRYLVDGRYLRRRLDRHASRHFQRDRRHQRRGHRRRPTPQQGHKGPSYRRVVWQQLRCLTCLDTIMVMTRYGHYTGVSGWFDGHLPSVLTHRSVLKHQPRPMGSIAW